MSIQEADSAKINIHSLSAFCEKAIREIEGLPENKGIQLISTLESIQLLKKLITGFSKSHPLKRFRGDVFYEINNLMALFSFMKTEGLTSQYLLQKINDALPEQTTASTSKTGFQNGPTPDKIILVEKMRAAVNEFDHYQRMLRENNRYDTDDIIYLVIKALEDNKSLLSQYQEKFEYIQADDDGAWNFTAGKLLKLLLSASKQPNLTTVEYDQKNVTGREITNRANTGLFELEPTLHWKKVKFDYNNIKAKELLYQPVITSYNSVSEEMAGITNQVYGLLQQNTAANKIAVIYQEDEYASTIERYFKVKNISLYIKRNLPVLDQPFIKKIIQLLRYVSTEHSIPFSGDGLLFEILHFDFYDIPPVEIAMLAVETNSKKYSKAPTAIRKLLKERANTPAKDLFDTGIDKNLKAVGNILETLIEAAATLPLRELFENIIHQALVLRYVDQSSDRIWLMELLAGLGNFIKAETIRNPQLPLNEFISVIDTMQQASLPLSINCSTGCETGVQLIKATEAGGGDFKYVFITGANVAAQVKVDWLNSIYNLPGINFDPGFNNFDRSQHRALPHLFYTTLTGNNSQLFVSFAKYSSEGNTLVPAMFLTEYLSKHSIPVNSKVFTADELSNYLLLDKTKILPEIAQPQESFIAPILKKFVMNVSALNSYLDCPLGFYYNNIIRIPAGKSEAMEFGSAIHYALENLFKKMSFGDDAAVSAKGQVAGKYQFPPASAMVEDFNRYMQSRRALFTDEAFERRIQYGGEVLYSYYNQYINSWNKVVSVERNMRGITMNGIPIKGKLDKLEFYGKEVIVVDYKSGDIEKAMPKMTPPGDKNPAGGDYWRQAVFYTLLVDNYAQKDWKVISTEFDFIEPDKLGEYRKVKLPVNESAIETVKQQIAEVWAKIQSRHFYTGCGEQDCHWCNFVKDNKLAVALHNTKITVPAN